MSVSDTARKAAAEMLAIVDKLSVEDIGDALRMTTALGLLVAAYKLGSPLDDAAKAAKILAKAMHDDIEDSIDHYVTQEHFTETWKASEAAADWEVKP